MAAATLTEFQPHRPVPTACGTESSCALLLIVWPPLQALMKKRKSPRPKKPRPAPSIRSSTLSTWNLPLINKLWPKNWSKANCKVETTTKRTRSFQKHLFKAPRLPVPPMDWPVEHHRKSTAISLRLWFNLAALTSTKILKSFYASTLLTSPAKKMCWSRNRKFYSVRRSLLIHLRFRYGKRIWTNGTDKARTTLKNAICFKIASVVAKADMLAIKVDVANPSAKPLELEVSFNFD